LCVCIPRGNSAVDQILLTPKLDPGADGDAEPTPKQGQDDDQIAEREDSLDVSGRKPGGLSVRSTRENEATGLNSLNALMLVYEFDFTIAGSVGIRYFFGVVCWAAEDHRRQAQLQPGDLCNEF